MSEYYDPSDWFWQIDQEVDQLYSSKRRAFIPVEAEAVQSFLARGDLPTKIASMAELKGVLSDQYPAGLPVDLVAYTAEKRWQLETGGIQLNGISVDTNRASQALIQGAFSLAQSDPAREFRFKTAAGFITLSGTDILAIGQAVAEHVQACFVWEAGLNAQIQDETITSEAQIDALALAF